MTELRLALALALLCAASVWDARSREVPDWAWMAGGGLGAALYALDWGDVDAFWVFSMGSGALVSLLAWRLLPVGGADVLAVVSLSVLCPAWGPVPVPPFVFLGGLLLEHVGAMCLNLRYNLADLARGAPPTRGLGGSLYERAMAFLCAHRRRPGERFTFRAESGEGGKRRIDLSAPRPDAEFERREGILVSWAMPAMPFMLAALAIAALAGALA